jgi:UDP-glucose 4-epimerase
MIMTLSDSDSATPWKGRSVLVAGGLGFIGSNLARRLCDLGAVVTVLDCLLPQFGGNRFNLDGYGDRVRTHIVDLRESSSLESLLEGQEVIFNLAGQSSHLDSMRHPETDLSINVTAQLRLLECCRRVVPGVRLVYASTRQIYGRPRRLPVDENHPIDPVDVNGINKLSAELYHLLYAKIYDLSACVLRLTNTIGPRMRIRDARQTFLGLWVRQLIEGKPIEVWGGHQLRDFNDVEDVVDALLMAGAMETLPMESYNLGSSEVISLLDLAHLMIELHGSGDVLLTPFPEERKKIDIGDYYSSYAHFQRATGWNPQRTLRQTLRRTLDYYTAYLPEYVAE